MWRRRSNLLQWCANSFRKDWADRVQIGTRCMSACFFCQQTSFGMPMAIISSKLTISRAACCNPVFAFDSDTTAEVSPMSRSCAVTCRHSPVLKSAKKASKDHCCKVKVVMTNSIQGPGLDDTSLRTKGGARSGDSSFRQTANSFQAWGGFPRIQGWAVGGVPQGNTFVGSSYSTRIPKFHLCSLLDPLCPSSFSAEAPPHAARHQVDFQST